MCGVDKFRLLWKMDTKRACPRCSECPLEDHLHIPRCTGPTATAEWDKRHKALRTWMTAHHTSPEIEWFIYTYMKTIRSPIRCVPFSSHLVQPSCSPLLGHCLTSHHRPSRSLGGFAVQGVAPTPTTPLPVPGFPEVSPPLGLTPCPTTDCTGPLHVGRPQPDFEDNLQYSYRKREVDISIREQYSMGTRDLPPTIRRMLTEPLPDGPLNPANIGSASSPGREPFSDAL